MKGLLLVVGLAGIMMGSLSAREFTDAKGRKINAELVGHLGDSVKLKIGRKVSTVKIDIFSKFDQVYIKEWIAKNPDKTAYRFRYYVDLDENYKGRVRRDGAAVNDKLKTRPHNYTMIVYNANGTELKDLEIRYEIYVNDVVDTVNNAYTKLAVGYKKTDKLQTIAGKMSGAILKEKGKIEITQGFNIHDYVDRDGKRVDQAAKDSVIGVRIRVYKDGKLLDEHIDDEDSARFKKAPWQDAKPLEVLKDEG